VLIAPSWVSARVRRGVPYEAIIQAISTIPKACLASQAGGQLVARKTEADGPTFSTARRPAPASSRWQPRAAGVSCGQPAPGMQLDAQVYEAAEKKARARTVYDVRTRPVGDLRVGLRVHEIARRGRFLAASTLPAVGRRRPVGASLVGMQSSL